MLLIKVCDAIVQSASTDVVKAAYDVCFDAVTRIILQSEDHSEMQVKISWEKLYAHVHFSGSCM